ncbi:PREDICTED: uncharacterized protein LOC105459155, partial [Wasmannia auropunctata]|uniref:uncharacterized protein LOC105459155 n=1 Tax=Wasmannia auropunctata TaxID=64793 RepID=UPI0005EED725
MTLLRYPLRTAYLLRKDMIFGHIVGEWPTLSPYLFIEIIWHLKCEDLLVESLMHIPLDLCVEILEITIKYIDELPIPRARRLIFLLIYKIYNKCLRLHLGILSEQNVTKRVNQLIMYFEILLDLLVSPKFIISHPLSEKQHGIFVKNILYYIKKCMHNKIKNHSENHNITKLFRLTYGNNFNEHPNYHHMLPAKEVKAIIIRLEQKLATLLLNQIKLVDCNECKDWENIDDDENPVISLRRAIIIECHYLREFMKQNEFLVTNEQLFLCLERLIGLRKSEKSILTIQELCHDIAKGKLHGMKELIKRYKEWDLSTLDFINKRIKFLSTDDIYVVLEYLHYIFAYLHTKAEKYRMYVSVLKIIIQLTVEDMDCI